MSGLTRILNPPEHEYIVIKTEDSQGEKKNPHLKSISKLSILKHITSGAPQPKSTTTKINSNRPNTKSYQLLESMMEEGALTPTPTSTPIYPPLSFSAPTHSLGDTLSLSTSKSSQAIIDSFDKGEMLAALDHFLGEGSITTKLQYAKGRSVQQIKSNLKSFELVVLANVVHGFAPDYKLMGKNYYWLCNMMFDAIIEIFYLDESINPKDDEIVEKFVPIDPHNSVISGHWLGWKVNHTDSEDLSKVVHDFKKAHTFAISEVKFSSSLNYY